MKPMFKGMISVRAFFAEDDLSEGVMSQIELLVSEPTSFIAVLFDHAWEKANGDICIYHALCHKVKGCKKGKKIRKFVVSYWQDGEDGEDAAEGSDYDVMLSSIILDLCKGTIFIPVL